MRFLADENIHRDIVQWLRANEHDVFWAAETARAETDRALLQTAQQDQHIILTADLDFGELVVRQRLTCAGVLLMRLERLPVEERIMLLARHWEFIETHAVGNFIVVGKRRIRIRPLALGA